MTGISCDVHSKGLARSGSEEAKMDWKPFGCYEYWAVVVLHYKGHRENTEQRAQKPVSNTGLWLSRCAIFNESQSLCSCCVLHLNCSLLSFVLSSFHHPPGLSLIRTPSTQPFLIPPIQIQIHVTCLTQTCTSFFLKKWFILIVSL